MKPDPVFTVYKTTCLVNGKIYIGVHKTTDPNDAYLGSGSLITAAIKKYGRASFTKEVLFSFLTAADAYAKEAEVATKEFVIQAGNYNVLPGGTFSSGWYRDRKGEKNASFGTCWVHQDGESKKVLLSGLSEYFQAGWVKGRAPKPRKPRRSRANPLKTPRNKITWEDACEIRRVYRLGGISQRALSAQFGISLLNVWNIIQGHTWPESKYTSVGG